jgi:hypothetical protein
MKSFINFKDQELFFESLNTAVEFQMTEDTMLPKQIYASASINGSDYGMSLVETTYDKVYMIELYRIVNVKKRTWSFKTPADIRPVLATFLKFMEASYPFIKNRMDGIIIDIPSKAGSERYQSLLTKIIKKTYIQTFRVVPVKKISDGARNYIFVTKKSVKPETIFKTVVFTKHFEFDPTGMDIQDIVSSENLETIAVPYKRQKETVSTKPSKLFAFKKLDLGNEIASSDIKLIDDISNKAVQSKGGSNVVDLLGNKEVVGDKVEEVPLGKFNLNYSPNDQIDANNIPIAGLIKTRMNPYTLDTLIKMGKTEKKMDNPNVVKYLKKAFKQVYDYEISPSMKKVIVNMGLANDNGLIKVGVKNKSMWEKVLNDAIDMPVYEANLASKELKELKKIDNNSPSNTQFEREVLSAKVLEMPFAISTTNEAFKSDNDTKWDDGTIGFVNFNEDISKKIDVVKNNEGYKKFDDIFKGVLNSIDTSKLTVEEAKQEKAIRAFKSYTASGFMSINPNLRNSMATMKDGNFILDPRSDAMFAFYNEYAVEMEEDMWVYRNCEVPSQKNFKPGDVFVDPAWLSTSLSSDVKMGNKPNSTRMKIYLPKGTKCIPILNYSSVSKEKEIMLPPFSRIRLTEVYHTILNNKTKPFVVGVYTGNGASSFYEAYKKGPSELKMLFEAKVQDTTKVNTGKDAKTVWDETLLSHEKMKELQLSKMKIKY